MATWRTWLAVSRLRPVSPRSCLSGLQGWRRKGQMEAPPAALSALEGSRLGGVTYQTGLVQSTSAVAGGDRTRGFSRWKFHMAWMVAAFPAA